MNKLKKNKEICNSSNQADEELEKIIVGQENFSRVVNESGEKEILFLSILQMFKNEPGNISATGIKRRFHISFARAAKIMKCFEKLLYVTPMYGAHKRELIISHIFFNWLFEKNTNEYKRENNIAETEQKTKHNDLDKLFSFWGDDDALCDEYDPDVDYSSDDDDDSDDDDFPFGHPTKMNRLQIDMKSCPSEDIEYEKAAKYIRKQDLPCDYELMLELHKIVLNKLVSIDAVRSLIRLIESSINRSHETDRNTFCKQIESFVRLPHKIYGDTYCDFDALEKELNKKVLHASLAIKALIRAFRSQLDGSNKIGTTVCLVGPAKCGKTTLIDEFCKIAKRHICCFDCIGVSDSAVFEGASYIYVNGNPSRIVEIMTEANICNPFVVFKNADKMQATRGDPTNALSKFIARPNNSAYMDIFVNVPFDLSAVNYILTADSEGKIPPILRNQALVIEMGSYELEDKVDIALSAIVPQILTENELTANDIVFESSGIIEIINKKAFEPGLAELIKIIKDITAQEAEKISDSNNKNTSKVIVDKEYIVDYFKRKNAKEILRMTDSKFESFRRLALHLPKYDAKEQDKILARAKLSQYYLSPKDESYFELLSRYPRGITTTDTADFNAIEKTVENYYGAKEAKEQLLTLIASNMLSNRTNGIVIGLIGNAGTGKTNFAQTAAKMLGRKFVSISMANLNNSSYITGTSEGIGKIAQAFIDAGSENPIILLDELEKASLNVQNTMLLYLDSIQNKNLKDSYLDIGIPIQQAIIIATINDVDELSFPVLDRLDTIYMDDYSTTDKVEIAKRSAITNIIKKFGFKYENIVFSNNVLSYIAKCYGIGAGFRRMEKALQRIIGACAKEVVAKNIKLENYKKVITVDNVIEILGEPLVRERKIASTDKVGVVNGLAAGCLWGDILPIEATVYPGNGEYDLTGSLGEVMRESARVARAAVRKLLALEPANININKLGINLHAPEGAIKKDGPSAGIAIAVALYSAITGHKVCGTLGMTGEINLQGDVLAVGGLEQKLSAGFASGLSTILVPEENRIDVDKIQNIDIDKSRIRYINTLKDALSVAIIKSGDGVSGAVSQ